MLSYQFGPQQHVLVVEKSSHTLFVFSNYQAEPLAQFVITTGRKAGQKQYEGDMRTPEGIYFFRRLITGDELPKTDDYGEKAFTMNYPNPIDRFESRSGSGIWLHGAFDREKTDNPNNSRGCVVLSNQDIIKLSPYIGLIETPIVIYDTIEYVSVDSVKGKRDRFISYLTHWKQAWESKDMKNYINSYSPGFYYSGMNLKEFKAYKKRLNNTYRFIKVQLSKINLYQFNNYYMVMFDQLYVSDRNHFRHKKIQYWKANDNRPLIAGEFSQSLPGVNTIQVAGGKHISLSRFRKEYLAGKHRERKIVIPKGINYRPGTINLKNILVEGNSIKLSLDQKGLNQNTRVIPVLLLKNKDKTHYSTLPGIQLKEGVPQDYYRGIRVMGSKNSVSMQKQEGFNLKSITLFVINKNDSFEQIITYFLNK